MVDEGKGQIVGGCAIHVDRMQNGVRTLHPNLSILRHQQNVGLVAAVPLVQEASGFGEIHRFPAGNVFQVYHGVCDTTLGPHNQPFQVSILA